MAEGLGPALEIDGDTLRLRGELDVATVTDVLEAGRSAIAALSGERVVLDLSGVTRSDSAGVALVVDWLRAARRRSLELVVESMPPQMTHIAEVSGLAGLLPGDARHAA